MGLPTVMQIHDQYLLMHLVGCIADTEIGQTKANTFLVKLSREIHAWMSSCANAFEEMFLRPRAAPNIKQSWVQETHLDVQDGYYQIGVILPNTTIGNLSSPRPPSERTSAYKRAEIMGAPSHSEVSVTRMDARHRLAVIATEDSDVLCLDGRRYEQAMTTEVISFD